MVKRNNILIVRLIIVILICFYLLLYGCVSLPPGLQAGKPSEGVKELLDKYGDPDKMIPCDLHMLCSHYGTLKDYNKLYACFDSMQKKIDQGVHEIRYPDLDNQVLGDLNVTLYLLRATALLELGRFDETIVDAQKGIDYLVEYKVPGGGWTLPEFEYLLGIAYAGLNQPDKARMIAKFFGNEANNCKGNNPRCGGHTQAAQIYSAVGDYQLALDHANKHDKFIKPALQVSWNAIDQIIIPGVSNDHIKMSHYFLMGKTNLDAGNIETAKKYFDLSLSYNQITQNRDYYWIILFERGRISEMEGNTAEAFLYYSKTVDVIEETRSTLSIEANKIGYAGDKQKVYYATISLLFREGKYQEALEYVERGKARALVDMLASKKTFSGSKNDADKLATLIKELDEAEKKSISLAYEKAPESNSTAVRSLTMAKRAEIDQTSKEIASLVSVKSVSIRDIQALLPSDETLVEYYYDGDTLYAFIMTQGSVKGVKLDSRRLNDHVMAFRKNMMDTLDQTRSITIKNVNPDGVADKSSAFRALRDSGRSLYEEIFKPLEPMITTKNVTIVPHGALHYVPFSALITDKDYLLDTYAIRVLPSSSVLQFLQTKRGGQIGDLIVFGNPDLNDPKLDLPFAQSEALAITKGNPKAKVLLRKEASKTAVKKFGDQFRYVHFACHGIFNADKPLESGLLLSKDNQTDGMLTVNELYDMRLNADLVTLSACETALGKVSSGDDVVGFTRGFLYAGTNSIVSSLWEVNDEATSILMQEFYKNLKVMEDKRAALRLAQLKVKDTYNSHPYFWAAFQLTGATQSAPSASYASISPSLIDESKPKQDLVKRQEHAAGQKKAKELYRNSKQSSLD